MPYGPRKVYLFVLQGVVNALKILGIKEVGIDERRYSVYANGRKISGSGQLTSKGVVNISGSFLVDFNIKAMSEVLKDPVKNLKPGVEKPGDGLTCLKNEVPGVTMEEAKEALKKGFQEILGPMNEEKLTEYEIELAEELKNKYVDRGWIYRADLRAEKRKRK